jgi:CDP-diacylglycerol--glycerol-3-phosphate 3-phosphatidyltransferase
MMNSNDKKPGEQSKLIMWLRESSRDILEAIARVLQATHISPNMLTVIGFVVALGVAAVLASGQLLLGGILMILAAVFDAFDGTLARVANRTSRFGAFLDSTLDRYSESVIFLGLLVYYLQADIHTEAILVVVALVGSLMVSYTRARAEGLGLDIKSGLLTRVERVLILIVGLISGWMLVALWLLAVLSNVTALQRIYAAWRLTGGERGH